MKFMKKIHGNKGIQKDSKPLLQNKFFNILIRFLRIWLGFKKMQNTL